LALVATVVAGAGYMAWDWLNVPTVEVPNVVGLNYMAAQNLLREQGLMAEQVATVFHDQVPANHVVEQIPPAFSMVKKGRSIKLVVSQGQASVIVPDLRGLTQREANVQLLNLGLALGHIKYEHHPTFALDTVIEQNPRANTVVSTSTPFVDVVVSLGPEPRLIKVPDLTGQQVGQAQRSLEALSLRLGELSKEHSDQPEGTVLRQEPTAGAEVEPDTVVNLWYSAGPLTSGQTDRIVFKVPKDRGTVLVQVWVADGTGSREVHKGTYRGDDEIELWIKWFGAQARVVVFVDGLPLYEVTLPQS
jgi:serine/threonine-protein kinase